MKLWNGHTAPAPQPAYSKKPEKPLYVERPFITNVATEVDYASNIDKFYYLPYQTLTRFAYGLYQRFDGEVFSLQTRFINRNITVSQRIPRFVETKDVG